MVHALIIAGLFGLASCVSVPNQVSGSAKAGAPLELPNPPQPEAQALVARFTTDFALVKKAGPAFFQPAVMAKWPCDISQSTIYQAAELTMADPVEAEKMSLNMRKSLREQGLDTGKGQLLPEYINVRISPVAAVCKGGKVDGEVELLTEYETRYEGIQPTVTVKLNTHEAGRVWVRFDAGKVAEPIKSIKRIFRKSEMVYKDKATNEMMTKYAAPQSKDPEITISYALNSANSLSGMFTVKMTPKVSGGVLGVNIDLVQELQSFFFTPTVGNGMRMWDHYSNKEWTMTMKNNVKDGKLHGEQITLQRNATFSGTSLAAMTPGARLVTFNGMEVMETRTSYINGHIVNTAKAPIVAAIQSNFAPPEKIPAPSPIAGNSGKYMSPFTSAGIVAVWAQKPVAVTDNGSELAASAGGAVGGYVAEKALDFVPFGLGGMFGKKAGETAARAATKTTVEPALPSMATVSASSDISFNSVDELAVYLYAKYSSHGEYGRVLALAQKVYPELQAAYTPAIEKASQSSAPKKGKGAEERLDESKVKKR
jgi:hypothetical protein